MDNVSTLNLHQDREWWIRYNIESKRILAISLNELLGGQHSRVFKTSNTICADILSKKVSVKKYSVYWDEDNEQYDIAERSNELNIDYIQGKFIEVERDNPNGSDLHVIVYKEDGQLDVMANHKNIKKSMGLSDISAIKGNTDARLNLYITKKTDPDYLINVIEIDPFVLLSTKRISVDISKITQVHDLNNISIFTRPIFKNYSLSIEDKCIVGTFDTRNRKTIQQALSTGEAHVYVYKQDNAVVVEHNLNEEQDYLLYGSKNLEFIICNGEIDNLAGGFRIANNDMLKSKKFVIPWEYDWPEEPKLFYKSTTLKIKYLGEHNA
jgi:hypothetical protein